MLKGIDPILSPNLIKILAEMGHGDEIVLADAHFPGHTYCPHNVIRADGVKIPDLLKGIMPLFELDSYDDPLIMMAPVDGDQLDPVVEEYYIKAMQAVQKNIPNPIRISRFDFYDRVKNAYACVITGTTVKYGNIILKKGVISSS